MKLPGVVGIGFFMIAAGTRVAADVSVSNDGLRATYEEPSRRLILAPRTSGASFAACDHFAPVDATVNAVTVNDKTFGKGKGLEVVHTNGQRDQVLLFPNKPFFFFRTTLKNGNAQTVTNRVAFQALTLNLGLPSSALNTLGTGGLLKPDKNPGSYMWTAVADPASRRGAVAGWVTTPTAAAVLCAWTSPMTSSASCRMWTTAASCSPPHRARRLRPSRWAFSMTSASASKPMPTPLPKSMPSACPPMPTVHCTWYVDGASRESVLTGRTDFAAQTLKPFGLGVIQIDDGWQLGNTKDGPKKVFIHYNPQGPYPSGMKPTADRIRKAGMTAGLWLIPFAGSSDDPWFADKSAWFAKKSDGKPYDTRWGGTCFDLTRADTQTYLKDVIRTITHDWGYKYLKTDGLYTGSSVNLNYICDTFREDEIGQAVLSDPNIAQIEMMRNSLKLVRETAGSDAFLLGCCTPQNMRSAGAAYGLVNAMRIGPDNGANWTSMMRGPEFGAWNYFLNRRVWYNDPDPLYVRASLPLEHAQVICSWVTLSGQMNSSSEHYAQLPPDRLNLLKRTMPSHTATARPVDLLENRIPRIWLVTDAEKPAHPRRDVIGLFNWDSDERIIDKSLAKIGLADEGDHIAFDFWSNALTPPFKGHLRQALRPQSCAVLAVRPVLTHPQLIATSRHITQGIVDVKEERWDAATRTLSGVSEVVAGDRYELRILTYTKTAVGAVTSVAITGPNGYELTIAPGEGLVTRPDDAYSNANTPNAPMTTLFEPVTEEGLVRAAFVSGVGGMITWKATFSDKPVPALVPVVNAFKAEMPDIYGPIMLTWQSNARACEILRDGNLVMSAAIGGVWRDTRVESKKSYRYEVIPYTLAGVRGTPQTTSFTVPEIPQLGETPPKPDVKLDAIKPVKTAVGWGSFKIGTALNGPLRLGKESFVSGICIHADGYAVYARDPAWRRFVAIVGIDESQRKQNQSSVIFSVAAEAADGRRMLAVSPVIRFGQRERWHFDVDLPKDAERIVLLSESAGDGNKSDHANWCDAGFLNNPSQTTRDLRGDPVTAHTSARFDRMSTMQEIDIATWKRKEHFSFFRKADLPFYNITAPVDISGLKEFAKTQACSFNTLLVYLTTKAMNTVENFKFRLRGETVVLHDRIHPSFAHLKNGDDLFSLITVDFSDDLSAFDQTVRAAIAACDSYFNLAHLKGRDDFVFISSIPWISFTGIDHTLSLKKDDAIPRVTWGKYFDDNGRTLLPFNIQVNHMFVDGLHVGRFFAKLDRDIQAIRTLKRESDTCG